MSDALCQCDGNPLGNINGIDKNHYSLISCPKFVPIPSNISYSIAKTEDSILKLDENIATDENQFEEDNLENYGAKNYDIKVFNIALRNVLKRKHTEAQLHLDYSLKSKITCLSDGDKINSDFRCIPGFEYRLEYCIFGDFKLKSLSASNYPPNILCQPLVYICEFCLDFMSHIEAYHLHLKRCMYNFNFGTIVYHKDKYKIYEIDGALYPNFSHRLCLVSKLFIAQKTVCSVEDVVEFIFYVLTKTENQSQHMIGYFSKQKCSVKNDIKIDSSSNKQIFNNLSCILTLPQYQNQGYGRMMIEFSYHLSLIDGKIGSPERPLSDSGLILYRKHWSWYVLDYLIKSDMDTLSLKVISNFTGIHPCDIASTLLSLKLLVRYNGKYFILKDKALYQEKFKCLGRPKLERRIDSNYIMR